MSNPPLDPKKDPTGKIFQGKACKRKKDCPGDQTCAHPGNKDTPKICCPAGRYYNPHTFRHYCRDLPNGYWCHNDNGCKNAQCGHPQDSIGDHNICCFSNDRVYSIRKGSFFCAGQVPGQPCSVDKQCTTRNCDSDGTCSSIPKLSFSQKLERILLYSVIAIVAILIIILIFKLM